MRIKLAASYGFCFGVKRAIKIAENTQNASTIGPLIHNNEEINRLRENFNVKTLHDISEAQGIERAIIRTHGIPKKDLETLKQSKVEVINATCPYVTKPQEICEKMSQEGYEIVIFGDADHPEVRGVESYAINGAYVVQSVSELEKIKFKGYKVAVVSQTTRKISEFLDITGYLQMRYKEVRVFNTICNATFENQDAARELAKEADVVIVIGGKNSSNTKQLHSICKEYCADSFLVESEKDLDPSWFNQKQLCGVTAGASTPDWIIEKIVGKISEIKV
ncbi:MAG: 4-hydroxy-3-methylbut-2-enyl diphosphate reductase [Epsilonproteobacteria bacterium]|uniref:4-hydroxy-3-methylbut-2-enyl diphosphate reductase n=1 Tax=Sulfurospirillum TaxID=57665 RepID=UPI0005433882|nr:4-hydroxy-3-methylbut-2-enyl diphosphate reductase [Sulfurospirillum sp. MES]KHG35163.1 MAG: 4-hydroxy-3-methylbut-2-enyl diphosphate reductase [Sulfurospirillum sp. MES]MCD8543598.1 4-hydroxy-3-methylbut-2-enyl diphosphate reductase [Sulfurospirillum cavolei]MDY0264628.1 4-hydroxy-3-methylbut-2-enyl diphosphate reductase [Sulfurospirillum cavolei]NCB53716.1 4-hydroxy-3-methylbut-2-enyl diphosphate reductase [Campylobacterota bacterium]